MIVAVDAVGGDHFPENPVKGGLEALAERADLNLVFVGPEKLIQDELEQSEIDFDSNRVDILHADQIVTMDDSASSVLKDKQNSSISVGLKHHRAGQCDAFVSAGHTGALLAASTVLLGKIEGVIRPTIGALYPTVKGVRLLVDAGANLELKPEMYYQFGLMGSIFTEQILGVENPKIGLVNVGEEPEKGTDLLKDSYKILAQFDNFIGNIEGKDILSGKADVFLTDGLTGNVILKFGESIPGILRELFKKHISELEISEDVQKQMFTVLTKAMHTFDYEHVGGIPFLGVNGISFVGHGGSSPFAIRSMILNASNCIENGVNEKIKASLN
ncbi:phosphate acyltransferase PlsX [Rhodohalobacter sp. SW132]|uniref:phosphate acyltransferase PlsX n=1 Tax=Rhodohalobacter sp. SW132 TaxID=2293433 RepID=UPI000E234F68|nr:phosphate acyltransferase PlsX [Rhodohalobacter sp. SW132]REL33670.1 phosphate acyltransferase PlsX [Rhodohalobacter sp. SW132]